MPHRFSQKRLTPRDILFGTYYYSGIGWLFNACCGRRRAIVSFHNVLDEVLVREFYLDENGLSTQVFEKQIQYLTDCWKVQPAAKIRDLDADGLFLTFDDGMRNNYTVVMPILEKYGITALFAVCPGLVGGDIPHIWQHHVYLILRQMVGNPILLPLDGYKWPVAVTMDNADQLEKMVSSWAIRQKVVDVYGLVQEICLRNHLPYVRDDYLPDMFHPLTWEMIADMRARGHLIISHTWSHRALRLLSKQEKEWEFKKSKVTLEEHLSEPVDIIAYPYGTGSTVDEDSIVTAREAGYRLGFLNVPYNLFGTQAMALGRVTLPARFFRPHLYASISGFTHRLIGLNISGSQFRKRCTSVDNE